MVSRSRSVAGARSVAGVAAFAVALVFACAWDSHTFTQIRWRSVTPEPVARTESMTAVVGGRLYVMGGFGNDPFEPVRTTYSFDPRAQRWSRGPDLGVPLSHAGTATDGRRIFLAGGYVGLGGIRQRYATRMVRVYDTVTGDIRPMTPLPEARGSGGLVLVGRTLHFFGGSDLARRDRGDHWSLDLDHRPAVWVRQPALPNPRSHLGYVNLAGRIYALGGQHSHDEFMVAQDEVDVFDPDRPGAGWRRVASLPTAMGHIGSATFVHGGRIIVLGGEPLDRRTVTGARAFEPGGGWRSLSPLPAARASAVGGVVGDRLYLAGGSTTGGAIQSTTWEGTPTG